MDSLASRSVEEAVARFKDVPGGLLPLLHAIQDEIGHVPPAAVPRIASALNLSRAEVHGVVSFYHHFRAHPAGRHVLHMCRAEACQSMGGDALAAQARERLGIDFHETTADGNLTLEPVYCLGHCACSPAVLLDGVPQGRMTAERLEALLASLEDAQ
ncbi:MAG TPA: formate dehydrogenase subunit gamma [Burkholderiales bacterium]|nr:formate dehydrogenase subunit gamma [Burkholderiales bacterium]